MKKPFLFAIIILNCLQSLLAQTLEIETVYLNEQLKSGHITTEAAKERNKELQIMNLEKVYPNIEFDTLTLQLGLKKVYVFPGQTKKMIYNRIIQWCALVNNDREAITKYQSEEDGKIILRGYCTIPSRSKFEGIFGFFRFTTETRTNCWMTIIFTIIDEKVKTEFVGMRYEFKELNYSQPTIITNDVDMVNLFPITQFDSGKMKNIANLLNSTISRISLMHLSMVKYVSSKDEDYKF